MALSQDERERQLYLDRLQADAASLLRAPEHARQQGREEGREKGLEEGKVIGRIEICQRLLKQPLTPTEELSRLSIEELTKLADQLERQLLPQSNGAG